MAEHSWNVGRLCGPKDTVELGKASVVAEVHSRALRPDDEGMVACYFLVHDLEQDAAERAMLFFSNQAALLVDVSALVEDAQAEFPALVTIRYTDDTAGYLATALEYDLLRTIPNDEVVSTDGWEIFCAREALLRGDDVDAASPLPEFDFRGLRRKIYANRSIVREDREPWLVQEYLNLREITKDRPVGCEGFIDKADDMQAAIEGKVDVGDLYSVVIPTKIERAVQDGALFTWIPQTGREIVIAHGLDALQAARALVVIEENPKAFVSREELLSSKDAREETYPAFVVADRGLNWISTDFSGRRNPTAYALLQQQLNAPRPEDRGQVISIPSIAR